MMKLNYYENTKIDELKALFTYRNYYTQSRLSIIYKRMTVDTQKWILLYRLIDTSKCWKIKHPPLKRDICSKGTEFDFTHTIFYPFPSSENSLQLPLKSHSCLQDVDTTSSHSSCDKSQMMVRTVSCKCNGLSWDISNELMNWRSKSERILT